MQISVAVIFAIFLSGDRLGFVWPIFSPCAVGLKDESSVQRSANISWYQHARGCVLYLPLSRSLDEKEKARMENPKAFVLG